MSHMQLLQVGWVLALTPAGWVLRHSETIAQGCSCPESPGDTHPKTGATCVSVLPPSDCMGGEIVWQIPFRGHVIVE